MSKTYSTKIIMNENVKRTDIWEQARERVRVRNRNTFVCVLRYMVAIVHLVLCVYHHYFPKLPSIPFICLFILLFSHLATHSICVLAINFWITHFSFGISLFFLVSVILLTLVTFIHSSIHRVALRIWWTPYILYSALVLLHPVNHFCVSVRKKQWRHET